MRRPAATDGVDDAVHAVLSIHPQKAGEGVRGLEEDLAVELVEEELVRGAVSRPRKGLEPGEARREHGEHEPAEHQAADAGGDRHAMTVVGVLEVVDVPDRADPRDDHVRRGIEQGGVPRAPAGRDGGAGWGSWHTNLLDPPTEVVVAGVRTVGDATHFEHSSTVLPLAMGAGIGGLVLGWVVFSAMAATLARLKRPFRGLEYVFANKFFFDELYREVLLRPAYAIARGCRIFDTYGVDGVVNAVGRVGLSLAGLSGENDDAVVDGAVRGVGVAAYAGGGEVSRLQNGRVRFYLSVSVGLVAVVVVLLIGKALSSAEPHRLPADPGRSALPGRAPAAARA